MSNFKRQGSVLVIVLVAILSLLVGGGVVYYYFNLQKVNNVPVVPITNNIPLPTVVPVPSSPSASNPVSPDILTGSLKRLPGDLKLLTSAAVYYNAGVFTGGVYKGYQRIAGVMAPEGPIQPSQMPTYIFATNDNLNYVVSGNPDTAKTADGKYSSELWGVDPAKVKQVVMLDSYDPQSISLDSNFSLFREGPLTQVDSSIPGGNVGILVTDFSSYLVLKSTNNSLKYYWKKTTPQTQVNSPSPAMSEKTTLWNKYVDGSTEVIVVDPAGLAYTYNLSTNTNVAAYPTNPDPSKYVPTPGLGFIKKNVSTSVPIYDSYGMAFPGGCSNNIDTTVVKNIADGDLVSLGSLGGIGLYVSKDKTSDLNKLEYDAKTAAGQLFLNSNFNDPVKTPSFSDYSAKNPTVLLKDYWGRWVVLGEYDYMLPGGCGKPVVYLYPTKPTKVKVSFNNLMQFDVAIPSYQNNWEVLAEPNATLHNLKPEDCSLIDTTKFGSEYAGKACATNTYPYLYWGGQVFGTSFPTISYGWVITKSDLTKFMNNKLDEVGMTALEKSDMLAYWLPEMLSKDAPYYRISFLQNYEMNNLVPMTISPRPDSVNRIFLDYTPLISKPTVFLHPEVLRRFVRNGFTLVEWGGKKF